MRYGIPEKAVCGLVESNEQYHGHVDLSQRSWLLSVRLTGGLID